MVKLSALRMKIDEAFRDVKSTRFGLNLELHRARRWRGREVKLEDWYHGSYRPCARRRLPPPTQPYRLQNSVERPMLRISPAMLAEQSLQCQPSHPSTGLCR
jgi:hypothetical protein